MTGLLQTGSLSASSATLSGALNAASVNAGAASVTGVAQIGTFTAAVGSVSGSLTSAVLSAGSAVVTGVLQSGTLSAVTATLSGSLTAAAVNAGAASVTGLIQTGSLASGVASVTSLLQSGTISAIAATVSGTLTSAALIGASASVTGLLLASSLVVATASVTGTLTSAFLSVSTASVTSILQSGTLNAASAAVTGSLSSSYIAATSLSLSGTASVAAITVGQNASVTGSITSLYIGAVSAAVTGSLSAMTAFITGTLNSTAITTPTLAVSGLLSATLLALPNAQSFTGKISQLVNDANYGAGGGGSVVGSVYGSLTLRVYDDSQIYADTSLAVGSPLPAPFLSRPVQDMLLGTLSLTAATFGTSVTAYSARVSGYVSPPSTGTYLFRSTCQDGATLYIGTRRLLNAWTYSGSQTQAIGTLAMTQGLWSPFVLEHSTSGTTTERLLLEFSTNSGSVYSTVMHGTGTGSFQFAYNGSEIPTALQGSAYTSGRAYFGDSVAFGAPVSYPNSTSFTGRTSELTNDAGFLLSGSITGNISATGTISAAAASITGAFFNSIPTLNGSAILSVAYYGSNTSIPSGFSYISSSSWSTYTSHATSPPGISAFGTSSAVMGTQSITGSGLTATGGQILFPLKGIYSLSFYASIPAGSNSVVGLSVYNGFGQTNGSPGDTSFQYNALAQSQSSLGRLSCSYIGLFLSTDVIVPFLYTSQSGVLNAMVLSVTLLYPTT